MPVTALLGFRSAALFAVSAAGAHSFFNGYHVEASYRHAAIVVAPDNHASALRVKPSMIGGTNGIPPTAGRNDRERFKWSRFQMLPNITKHACNYNSRIRQEANVNRIATAAPIWQESGERQEER